MIFNTPSYFLLFLIPAAILFRLTSRDVRPWVCVAFGVGFFVFYSVTQLSGWFAAACGLILVWEALFSRLYRPGSWVCFVGIALSLAVLGVFKYWNFATDTLFAFASHNPAYWPDQFLPLGISFFTFEFIHYAADRYSGKAERGRLADYMAFIFFFPTMVAGPIKRYQQFVPCLVEPSADWAADWNRGITRILTGLVKKFAVADLLTAVTDHLNQADIATAERWVLPVWLFAYGWKIYFDFSAYSDIAIGSARLFGIKVPENFDWPYFRGNIAEFWRHWHMSLYRWLVDYVFIPLGGSRVAVPLIYRNILATMLVSGLWHGAGWGFVVWGLWHGLMLVIHRMWSQVRSRWAPPTRAERFAGWLLTYVMVNLAWAFFVMDFDTAVFFFRKLLLG